MWRTATLSKTRWTNPCRELLLDINVLVYATDRDSPFHDSARDMVARCATGLEIFSLAWRIVMGYLRVVTHPRILRRPLSAAVAQRNIAALLACSNCRLLAENERFWPAFKALAEGMPLVGNLVPDAHIAALMLANGVRRICTRDRDFRKFDRLVVIDPFAAEAAP